MQNEGLRLENPVFGPLSNDEKLKQIAKLRNCENLAQRKQGGVGLEPNSRIQRPAWPQPNKILTQGHQDSQFPQEGHKGHKEKSYQSSPICFVRATRF
jgi:hypothetical protein